MLACLLRSVGPCRKPRRQGCLLSQEVCLTTAPTFSFFLGAATRHEGYYLLVARINVLSSSVRELIFSEFR